MADERDEVGDRIAQLRTGDRRGRCEAAQALGAHRGAAVVDALLEALEPEADAEENLSGAPPHLCRALGQLADPRAVELLLRCMARPHLAGPAIGALEAIHDARAFEPIVSFFERNPASDLATVLGRWGDRRAVPALLVALGNPDPHLRFYAARALGRLGDERALPALDAACQADVAPILDTASLRGKSVADVARVAADRIRGQHRLP